MGRTAGGSNSILIISTVIFLLYYSQVQFRPFFPFYVNSRGGGEAALGLIIFLNWTAQALFSIPSGSLSDKVGRRTTIILGGLVAAGGLAVLPVAPSVSIIMLSYTIAGFGQGSYSTATAAYPIDLASRNDAGRAIGWTQAARQSALSFGPTIGGILAIVAGFDIVFILSSFLAIFAVILSRALLPSLVVDRGMNSSRYGVRDVLGSRVIMGALVAALTLQFSNSVFLSFIPSYAKINLAGVEVLSIVTLLFTLHGVMNVIGRPLVGVLSNRIGHKVGVISIAMILGSSGLFLLSLRGSLEIMMIASILVGLSTGIGIVLLLLTVGENAPRERRGFVIGFYNTSIYLGLGLGPAIEGLVIENFGHAIAFQSSGLVPLLGLIIFATLSLRRRNERRR